MVHIMSIYYQRFGPERITDSSLDAGFGISMENRR